LDVHKESVSAGVIFFRQQWGRAKYEVKVFGTCTGDLNACFVGRG